MNTDFVIDVNNVSKNYKLYEKPIDRLKESLNPFGKKYFKEFYALKGISVKIKKGETVGIIGRNGSGKSTLLKIITGVLMPTEGTVTVNGNISALLELGAGFNPELTGIENIYLNGTIMGYNKSEIDQKLDEILSFAEIGEFVYQPVKMFSSGMFARLAFSVAISVEPDILIVDESLAVGDIRFQSKCFQKFRCLQEKGVTILFVSHDVFAIRNFCNKAIWINEGRLYRFGDTLDVTADYIEFMNNNERKTYEFAPIPDNTLIKQEDFLEKTDFKPLNRWGSHVGSIQFVEIYNSMTVGADTINFKETVKIKVIAFIENDISTDFLSIAFSIKNSHGIDLLVSTTFDEDVTINKNNCFVEVDFSFINYLCSGDYILNVAIEDRSQTTPVYYDFIEGAKFFKSVSNRQLFGLINIPVEKKINYIGGKFK